jgi:hypothetical protein
MIRAAVGLLVGLATCAVVQAGQPSGGFVRIEGPNFVLNGKPYKLKGSNYYPRDYMWAKLWDQRDLKAFARDAGMMRGLGMNCVRILVPYSLGGWKGAQPPAERVQSLVALVNLFGSRGMRSVVTLFDWETSWPEEGSKREAEHLSHVNAIVGRLKDNPYVLMWDVKNEPEHPSAIDGKDDWECCPEKRDKIVSWLQRMCDAVRAVDQNHPVGVGLRWWANTDEIMDFVDVAMFHSYWPNIGTEQIPFVKKAMGGRIRPILVEEFGWPTNPNPCQREDALVHDYSEKDQLAFYEKHLGAFKEHDIAGCIQWMTFDAAKYSDNPKESFEQYFGLWRYDYALKPAGALYRVAFKVEPFPTSRPAAR